MKVQIALLALVSDPGCGSRYGAGTIYDNGPINGEVDAFTINFGFEVSDTFHLANSATVSDLSFGAWVFPGDTVTSVEVAIGSSYFSNNLFDQIVNLTRSNCFANGFAFRFARNRATSMGRT